MNYLQKILFLILTSFVLLLTVYTGCQDGEPVDPSKGIDRQGDDDQKRAIALVTGKVYDTETSPNSTGRADVRVNVRVDNIGTYTATTDSNGDYSVIIMVKYIDEENMGSNCEILMEYDLGNMKRYIMTTNHNSATTSVFKVYPGETVLKNIHFGGAHEQWL
ncbi:MAG: hypothetical protein GY754_31760 [bacterium]|nr:hypothetical protein [bacterium]